MSHCYKFAVAQFPADEVRNERLNLAIVILKDNKLDVRAPKSLDKLRAISGAVDLDAVRETLNDLAVIDDFARENVSANAIDRIAFMSNATPIAFSSLGEFYSNDEASYNANISKLLEKLVEPEKAPPRAVRRRPTKLLLEVKSAFKSERVLAKKGEGLETHRIVENHKVAEGLSADLILKNGAMHVIQTADASAEDSSVRRTIANIAISALVFEQARMTFGEDHTKPKLVYKASSGMESIIAPSLEAAEHQGATLINWESRDDRNRFVIELASLAEPTPKKGQPNMSVHASVQPRLKLN